MTPSLGNLPIKGGWGYSQATACLIDKNDPTVDPGRPFNGVEIEYVFTEYRLYEELIIFRPAGQKYAGIRSKLTSQCLFSHERRHYDHLFFQIQAFREEEFDWLKSIYECPKGIKNPNFDAKAQAEFHNSRLHTGTREY